MCLGTSQKPLIDTPKSSSNVRDHPCTPPPPQKGGGRPGEGFPHPEEPGRGEPSQAKLKPSGSRPPRPPAAALTLSLHPPKRERLLAVPAPLVGPREGGMEEAGGGLLPVSFRGAHPRLRISPVAAWVPAREACGCVVPSSPAGGLKSSPGNK